MINPRPVSVRGPAAVSQKRTGTTAGSKFALSSRLWQFFFSFTLILMLTFSALASTKPLAITGKIVNQYGAPVSGANVILKDQATGKTENLSVDAEGRFIFNNAATGEYQLSVVANGFVIANQQISLNGESSAELVLTLATLGSDSSANAAGSAAEVQQLRSQLAETNQQLAKLASVVQELQAKLDNKNQPAIETASLPAATPANPQPASTLRRIFGNPVSTTASTSSTGTPQEQQPEHTPLIDTLVAPKSKGGQFSGAEGLLKTERLKIGGYGDFRYFTRGADEGFEVRANADENNEGMTDTTNFKRSGFISPRLVIAFAAALTDRLFFNSEVEFEFAGAETEVEQAYLEYRFHPAFNFRGGVIVPPLGRFNLFHDSNLQDIAFRPLVSTYIIPSTYKDAGVGILGEFNIGKRSKLGYEVYVVNGLRSDEGGEFSRKIGIFESKGNNRFFDNNPQKSVVGRLMFSPIIGTEIGFSGYRGKHDNQGQYDLSICAVDFKFARGPFQVIGEYARTSLGRAPEEDSEIAARNFLLSLPKGDYTNTFEFLNENVNEALFDKPARSSEGFYIEARYRFTPKWFTSRTAEDGSIAPVFRFDQVNFDRSFPKFSFPLNMRRYSVGLSIRPTEAASFNFTYNIDRKPGLFLKLPDGRPFPPFFTNAGVNNFTFGMSYAF